MADIFRRCGTAYRARHRLPLEQLRVLRAVETCRTAALGGHVERCGHCDHQRVSYNSCRNRHCPKCQNTARARWVERRKGELLPVEYFHLVFTIPEQLNDVARQNAPVVYKLLFDASARTLHTIAADRRHLGARIGFFSVLHTWGQNLLHHPHVHCVATGGGLSPEGAWVACRPGFFLPVRVLSRLFRRLLLEGLDQAFALGQLAFHGALATLRDAFPDLLARLRTTEWVVYAKPPFGGPQQVIDYLGRYTHRVAISNHRLRAFDGHTVSFDYRHYRSADRHKTRRMTLTADEFIRRFLLHTLPPGFQRIRHYGLLAGRDKAAMLALCRERIAAVQLLPSPQQLTALAPQPDPPDLCPACRRSRMIRVQRLWPIPFSHPCAYDSS